MDLFLDGLFFNGREVFFFSESGVILLGELDIFFPRTRSPFFKSPALSFIRGVGHSFFSFYFKTKIFVALFYFIRTVETSFIFYFLFK